MQTTELPVAYSGPVVLVHLADDHHPELVACSPRRIPRYSADQYPDVPRQLCEACRRVAAGS